MQVRNGARDGISVAGTGSQRLVLAAGLSIVIVLSMIYFPGDLRMIVILTAFIAGSFWSSLHMGWWQGLPSVGPVLLARGPWPLLFAVLVLALLSVSDY